MRFTSTIALLAASAAAVTLNSKVVTEVASVVQNEQTEKPFHPLETTRDSVIIDWSSQSTLFFFLTYDEDQNGFISKEEAFKTPSDGSPHMMRQLESVCYPHDESVSDEILGEAFDMIAKSFGRSEVIEFTELFTFVMKSGGVELYEAMEKFYCSKPENAD